MERAQLDSWLDSYVRAWSSNDPAQIGRLFTDGARYYTAPYRDPWTGREAIVSEWIRRKDEPGGWEFRYEVAGIDGDVGFVRGWTRYAATPEQQQVNYSNLWMIRLDPDGRCSEFIEWWMQHS